jgi:uncharacterized iron-regulated membrane protein
MSEVKAERGFQGGFRQSISWLHTWAGLVLSVLLYFMFVTGSTGYFRTEIDRWMQPELPPAAAANAPPPQMLQAGLARLADKAPTAREWYVSLPHGRLDPYLNVWAAAPPGGRPFTENLDAATGQPVAAARETGGGSALYAMHYLLHYLPERLAMYLVGAATMFMLVALVTGLVVHKKIFRDFFTFRPRKGQRSWLDAHNLSGVMALPFMLMITYSGLVFYADEYMPSVRAALYGTGDAAVKRFQAEQGDASPFYATEHAGRAAPPAPISPMLDQATARWGPGQVRWLSVINPGDANARVGLQRQPIGEVQAVHVSLWFDGVSGRLLFEQPAQQAAPQVFADVVIALHEGHFAGPVLRWLYFASGLLGAAMIATGLVLWTGKRRQRLERGQPPDPGLGLVERLNVGTIVGLPIAVAAYFWANRLLPLSLPDRADWELHGLFIAWAAMLLHAALRPARCAWREQWALAAVLLAGLPLLNAITTDAHLGRTLVAGDWVRAGFDLTALAFGAAAALAWRWSARRAPNARRPSPAVVFDGSAS